MSDHEARLRRQVAASRHDPSNGEAAMAWAVDEIDRLRARVVELEAASGVTVHQCNDATRL